MSVGENSRISHAGEVYCVSDDLKVAVQVALATERPLLLFGNPGSGKSSVAMWAAHESDWRYYEHTVTARTQPQDLLWSYDSIRRLSDATAGVGLDPNGKYVRPGVLWWAFDRDMAASLATSEPDSEWNGSRQKKPAVVLIDEIDKADPDLPNSLLVPLGNRNFIVRDLDENNVVQEPAGKCSLIIVTTNEERELPQPFIRRCVVFTLPDHEKDTLVEIAKRHFTDLTIAELSMVKKLVGRLVEERKIAEGEGRRAPSTAEFIDAVRACRKYRYDENRTRLEQVIEMLYVKQPHRHPEG